MSKSTQRRKKHNSQRSRPAYFPEIPLGLGTIDDVAEIHAVVACEEGKGKEDDCDDGKDHYGFVLGVGYYGKFVLFDGAELE